MTYQWAIREINSHRSQSSDQVVRSVLLLLASTQPSNELEFWFTSTSPHPSWDSRNYVDKSCACFSSTFIIDRTTSQDARHLIVDWLLGVIAYWCTECKVLTYLYKQVSSISDIRNHRKERMSMSLQGRYFQCEGSICHCAVKSVAFARCYLFWKTTTVNSIMTFLSSGGFYLTG